jgi:hypothetical protein
MSTERSTIRPLTRGRMAAALAVAIVADALQLAVFATPPACDIIDVVVMIIVTKLIGFHLLLLPTFAIELIPVVDALPTWTACTAAVIALRKREQRKLQELPAAKLSEDENKV